MADFTASFDLLRHAALTAPGIAIAISFGLAAWLACGELRARYRK